MGQQVNQNQLYYDFMNMNDALSRALIKNGFPNSIHYLKDIASVKVGMFKYKDIEKKIPGLTSEILETIVLFNNFLCFWNGPAGLILCRYQTNSTFNEYLKPTSVNLIAINGTSLATNVPYEDIVIVKDNSLDIIPFICMVEYIRKIEYCDSAVFKALNVATLPLVIAGNKRVSKTLSETAKKIGSPDAFIVGDDNLIDTVKSFDIDIRVNPLDIYELKTKYKNECVASLGIYTIEQKKERKIVSEVSSQNEYTDSIYEDMRCNRVNWIDGIKRWGIDLELVETKRTIAERHIKDTVEMMGLEEKDDDSSSSNSKTN